MYLTSHYVRVKSHDRLDEGDWKKWRMYELVGVNFNLRTKTMKKGLHSGQNLQLNERKTLEKI